MYTIVLLFNLEFFLKYQSRGIMNHYYMWFMLSEDLGNMNPRHEFICIYMCGGGGGNAIACDADDIEMKWCWYWWCHWDGCVYMYICGMWLFMMLMTLRWDDVDIDDVIEMDVSCVCTLGVQWPCLDILGEGNWFKNYKSH